MYIHGPMINPPEFWEDSRVRVLCKILCSNLVNICLLSTVTSGGSINYKDYIGTVLLY